MKNLALPCRPLLFAAILIFSITASAQTELIEDLLSLPAPTAPISYSGISPDDPEFYSYKNIPADDAPIEILLLYWARWNAVDPFYAFVPAASEMTIARLLEECRKRPSLASRLQRILKQSPGSIEAVDQIIKSADSDYESDEYVDGVDRYTEKVGDAIKDGDATWDSVALDAAVDVDSTETDEDNSIASLIWRASKIKDTDEYLTNHRPLLDLAVVSPKAAKTIAEKYAEDDTNPITRTLGRWILYKLAYDANDDSEAESYRALLIETIENKSEKPGNRDLAMDAIVKVGDYPGREDWYFGLFEDETLFRVLVNGQEYTGLTTMINHSPPDKYIDQLVELSKSKNQALRNIAAKCLGTLLGTRDPRVVGALIPWLEDENWAVESRLERRNLVNALETVRNPASVEGLLKIFRSELAAFIRPETKPNTASGTSTFNVSQLIRSLGNQRDIRASSDIRGALPNLERYLWRDAVKALYLCGGFSVEEQAAAIIANTRPEANALDNQGKLASSKRSFNDFDSSAFDDDEEPTETVRRTILIAPTVGPSQALPDVFDPELMPGFLVLAIESVGEPSDDLIRSLIEHVRGFRKTNPNLARGLRTRMVGWNSKAALLLYVSDLANSEADLGSVIRLLADRKDLTTSFPGDVASVEASNSDLARGVLPCLWMDGTKAESILSSTNAMQKSALFACARLTRFELAYELAEKSLTSENPLEKYAAAKYLETVETDESRIAIWKAFPDEIAIVGARQDFIGEMSYPEISLQRDLYSSVGISLPQFYGVYDDFDDEALIREIDVLGDFKNDSALDAVYTFSSYEIRRKGNTAQFRWWDDPARFYERDISAEEFEGFREILDRFEFSTLETVYSGCSDCSKYELLLANRDGGRRIFLEIPDDREIAFIPTADFAKSLKGYFESLKAKRGKLRYRAEGKMLGLETVFNDPDLRAEAFVKSGNTKIVGLKNNKLVVAAQKEMISSIPDKDRGWDDSLATADDLNGKIDELRMRTIELRALSSNGPSAPIAAPSAIDSKAFFNDVQESYERALEKRSADGEVSAVNSYPSSVFVIRSGNPLEIKGRFDGFELSADGKYLAAGSISRKPYGLKVVNLDSGVTKVIGSDSGFALVPASYIENLGAFLACAVPVDDEDFYSCDADYTYFLIDPVKGKATRLKGDVDILDEAGSGWFESAGGSDIWIAIQKGTGTAIGKYSLRDFTFKQTNYVPGIIFDSSNFKVFESEGVGLAIYNGDILKFPLYKPKDAAKPVESVVAAPNQD
ncbi:MAG: HEAT repeat domain-containing protein [Pyrinomonadaceae bacterium]